jgi:hypothetical protein
MKKRAWKTCGEKVMHVVVRSLVLAVASLIVGCSTSSPTGLGAGDAGHCGDGDGGSPPPAQTCADVVDALARANVRCAGDAGADYASAYSTFLTQIAAGDCNNIVSIRDEIELCSQCLPSLTTIACADIASNNLPRTCNLQLERNQ